MKQKVKGYTRLVYNSKKQKIQPKKGLRIKKTTVALFVLFTALAVVALQFRGLINEIGNVSHSNEVKVPKGNNSQVEEINVTVKPVEPVEKTVSDVKGYYAFKPKTQYFDNELEIFRAVVEACKHHGLDNENCHNDLMGMAYAETRDFTNKLGDGNLSRGVWQIHKGYHPEITDNQANDIYWASKWTLRRMIFKGYKTNRDIAIRSHNGSPTNPKTLAYLQTVNEYINK